MAWGTVSWKRRRRRICQYNSAYVCMHAYRNRYYDNAPSLKIPLRRLSSKLWTAEVKSCFYGLLAFSRFFPLATTDQDARSFLQECLCISVFRFQLLYYFLFKYDHAPILRHRVAPPSIPATDSSTNKARSVDEIPNTIIYVWKRVIYNSPPSAWSVNALYVFFFFILFVFGLPFGARCMEHVCQ